MKNDQIDYRHLVEVLGQPRRRSDEVPRRPNVARVRLDEATAQELAMLLADEHAKRVAAQYEARIRGAAAEERLRLRHASRRIQRLLWETRRTIREQGWNE